MVRDALSKLASTMRRERLFALLMATQIIAVGGAFLFNIPMSRMLGPDPRGQVAFFLQFVYASAVAGALGRPQSILAVGGASSSTATTFRYGKVLIGPVLLVVILAAPAAGLLLTSLKPGVVALAFFAQVFGGIVSSVYRSVCIVAKSPVRYLLYILGNQLLMFGGAGYAIVGGYRDIGSWVHIYTIASVVPAICVLGMSTFRSPGFLNRSDSVFAENYSSYRKYGLRIVPSYIFEYVGARLDRFALPFLASYAQLGIYTVAMSAMEVAVWPMRQLVDTRMPIWAAKFRSDAAELWPSITKMVFLVCGIALVVAVVFSCLTVPLFGSEYAAAVRLYPYLGAAAALHGVMLILIGLSSALAVPNVGVVAGIVSAMACLISLLSLVPRFGAAGAALATIFGYVFGLAAGASVLIRQLKTAKRGPHE